MALQANPYPLRIDKTVMDKMRVIASTNGRSVNKEIEYHLKIVVSDYESQHGSISLSSPSESE